MKTDSLKFYRCIKCRSANLSKDTAVSAENNGEIIKANIRCADCGAYYRVKDGVPRFFPENSYTDSFGFQWNMHRKTQLDSFTGLPITKTRLSETTAWPKNLKGLKILEAASGAGRFTEIILQAGAEVFSFDLSSAVNANYANNGSHPNLHLFQGDIYNIPLEKGMFEKVICLGAIQHTPDPEKTFRCLSEYVKEGGELIIDVYAKRLISLLHWKNILRPVTVRADSRKLYKVITLAVPLLLPFSIMLRKIAGRFGARLLPIAEYSNLGLNYNLNKEWSILDTFDMYSPKYDNPQSLDTVKKWFREAGFTDITVKYGPNGVIGRGRKCG